MKWILVLLVLTVCLIPVVIIIRRRGLVIKKNPLQVAPNTVIPVYVRAPNASETPDRSWCNPFAQSQFAGAVQRGNEKVATCVTAPGNGRFDVRKIGEQLKRSKIQATIK